jgi:hypothetical protein
MRIQTEHLNAAGILTYPDIRVSLPAMLKHMSIAGQSFMPSTYGFIRAIGIFFHYYYYFDHDLFYRLNRFQPMPEAYMDPTEKGTFSMLVGKAIADFMAKRLYNANFTYTYEAAMVRFGFPISGSRPDLYCENGVDQFAVEAKGFSDSTMSPARLLTFKAQSQNGPIPVRFSLACISFNIYDNVQCKIYDPVNANAQYNKAANLALSSIYYSSLFEALESIAEAGEIEIAGQRYLSYKIPAIIQSVKMAPVSFLINSQIKQSLSELGPRKPFKSYMNENIYIDNDGVGVKIG